METDQGLIEGRIIIGADGVESRIARFAGLDSTLQPKDLGSCLAYVIKDVNITDPDSGIIHF